MTSANERAVEAGARAGSPAAFDPNSFVGIPHRRQIAERFARKSAAATLRAAFPILAEELVAWHDEQAEHQLATAEERGIPFHLAVSTAGVHRAHASALRARIQQMAEAL